MAPPPMPPMTPSVNVKISMLLLNCDTLSPMQPMIHPEIQMVLIPNLFVKPPMIGPIIALTPERIDPTKVKSLFFLQHLGSQIVSPEPSRDNNMHTTSLELAFSL